jgi:GNAT superfamily N-acetyltransferase
MSAIARGMFKAVNEKGEIIGFIGEHPEHALGMLYIDEAYRRQGIGRALEQALINKFIDEGKIPFDHVVITNDKSIHLQNSLGMTLSEGNIYWYF